MVNAQQKIDEPSCDMCGEQAETNEHVLCHCTATQCNYAKGKVTTMMVQNIQSNGGDIVTQDMMATIYGTMDTGAAVDRQVEYDALNDTAKVKNAPESWSYAYQHKGETESTFQSVADAWAYEHLLRVGGNMPLWTGVITKQFLLLLKWGGIEPNKMTRTIIQMRHILAAHAKVVWKNRCKTVYSPENEAKRFQRTQEKMASRVIQDTSATGYTTAIEVMSMTPKQKAQLRQNMIGGWQDPWAQMKFTQLFQPALVTTQTRTQRQPAKIEPQNYKAQRTITTQGGVGPSAGSIIRPPTAGRKKPKLDNSQPTLKEVWRLGEEPNGKTLVSPNGEKNKEQHVIPPRIKGNEGSEATSAISAHTQGRWWNTTHVT